MEGGATLGAHQRQLARSSRQDPDDVGGLPDMAAFPVDLLYLWEWWTELHFARAGEYVMAISFREIEAFARMYGISLEPWEVDVLRQLDKTWWVTRNAGHRGAGTKDQKR